MKTVVFAALLFINGVALCQTPFTLAGVIPDATNHGVDVDASGTIPNDLSPFVSKHAWRVWNTKPNDKTPTESIVEDVTWDAFSRKFILVLSGPLPNQDEYSTSTWTVIFSPALGSGLQGSGLTYTPPVGTNQTPASNCDPKSAGHYFCVPASGATPDISFSGTFAAAGGTKPLYQFELLAGLYTEKDLGAKFLHFRPGLTTKTEINQNASAPIDHTTFDPDSITGGFALQRQKYLSEPRFDLYGIQFDETLPGGEFTRKDPTSNILVGSSAEFILRSFTIPGHLTYATLYPLIGMEVGHNLNKPKEYDSVAVDLSKYDAIVRGIGGANASFARKAKDASADVWSLAGTYLVRIPATKEPLVKTLHQTTSVLLTDRARHWIEVDGNLSPWSFKYLAITAKYQFGDLPPAFKFVDHSFSVGLTLKASQSNKPNTAGPPLLQ